MNTTTELIAQLNNATSREDSHKCKIAAIALEAQAAQIKALDHYEIAHYEIAQALGQMIMEIEQSGQTHCLGSCYESANRLLKTWWQISAKANKGETKWTMTK